MGSGIISVDMKTKLMLPDEYLADATRHIANATTRVSLLTMIVVDDPKTHILIDALCEAAEHGLTVTVAADMFTYTEIGGHFRFNTRRSKKVRHLTAMQHRLQKSGVTFRWLGKAASSLINGRTHSKWLVVDDTVYAFGGVNLYELGLSNTDYMFTINDALLADHLAFEEARIIKADHDSHAYRSHTFGDDTTQVLIDGGFSGDSIIYRHACKLARAATDIVYVSQFCPTGKLAHLLAKTNSTLYFNPWNQATSLNALAIRMGSALSGLKTSYTRPEYLHCKFMLFTLPDGSKRAITGSHNFSAAGVWLGTREVALETSDPHIIKQLERFVADKIA